MEFVLGAISNKILQDEFLATPRSVVETHMAALGNGKALCFDIALDVFGVVNMVLHGPRPFLLIFFAFFSAIGRG